MQIDSIDALEACIGKTPPAINMKVIDHVDDGARKWIEASTLAFVAFEAADGVRITLAGGDPGFALSPDRSRLSISTGSFDDGTLVTEGRGFGALFIAANIGETLRVNGRVTALAANTIELRVDECYMHCAKALIRSDFWRAADPGPVIAGAADLFVQSRFLALASIDAQGHADVSPKGDPAGALIRMLDDGVWYADRPGNRRADSFRNMIVQPRIALAALVPGSNQVAIVTGIAKITKDERVRAAFAVNGKTPLLATCVNGATLALHESPALARARLWPVTTRAEVHPAAVVATHVRLNQARGLQATLVRAAAASPKLIEKGLQRDYKTNLY